MFSTIETIFPVKISLFFFFLWINNFYYTIQILLWSIRPLITLLSYRLLLLTIFRIIQINFLSLQTIFRVFIINTWLSLKRHILQLFIIIKSKFKMLNLFYLFLFLFSLHWVIIFVGNVISSILEMRYKPFVVLLIPDSSMLNL